MLNDKTLALLQAAVAAKVIYWNAVRNLEKQLLDGDEPSDRQSDQLTETIENLAVGLDTPEDASKGVDMKDLEKLALNLGIPIPATARNLEQAPA